MAITTFDPLTDKVLVKASGPGDDLSGLSGAYYADLTAHILSNVGYFNVLPIEKGNLPPSDTTKLWFDPAGETQLESANGQGVLKIFIPSAVTWVVCTPQMFFQWLSRRIPENLFDVVQGDISNYSSADPVNTGPPLPVLNIGAWEILPPGPIGSNTFRPKMGSSIVAVGNKIYSMNHVNGKMGIFDTNTLTWSYSAGTSPEPIGTGGYHAWASLTAAPGSVYLNGSWIANASTGFAYSANKTFYRFDTTTQVFVKMFDSTDINYGYPTLYYNFLIYYLNSYHINGPSSQYNISFNTWTPFVASPTPAAPTVQTMPYLLHAATSYDEINGRLFYYDGWSSKFGIFYPAYNNHVNFSIVFDGPAPEYYAYRAIAWDAISQSLFVVSNSGTGYYKFNEPYAVWYPLPSLTGHPTYANSMETSKNAVVVGNYLYAFGNDFRRLQLR